MKKLLITCIMVTLSAGCATTNSPTKIVALFNGTNLDNWVIENGGQFSVQDGVLNVNRGTGWLRSTGIYADFTLVIVSMHCT